MHSRCFYNPTVLSLTGFRSQNTRSCVSRSFSFSRPLPRRQVVNEITASGVARHAKLIKVCAPRAFRSRLPSSGAERTRASTYDDNPPALFLSLLCSLLMREHSRRDSRPRLRRDVRERKREESRARKSTRSCE